MSELTFSNPLCRCACVALACMTFCAVVVAAPSDPPSFGGGSPPAPPGPVTSAPVVAKPGYSFTSNKVIWTIQSSKPVVVEIAGSGGQKLKRANVRITDRSGRSTNTVQTWLNMDDSIFEPMADWEVQNYRWTWDKAKRRLYRVVNGKRIPVDLVRAKPKPPTLPSIVTIPLPGFGYISR